MKRLFTILTFTLLNLVAAHAGDTNYTGVENVPYPGGKCYIYRVGLTDKYKTTYSLDKPEAFLSERAIERRKRQYLPVDSTDLPVPQAYLNTIHKNGFEIVGKSKWNNTVLVRMRDKKNLRKLSDLPFVRYVMQVFASPDSCTERYRQGVDKSLSESRAPMDNIYGASYSQINNLHGDELHKMGLTGQDMMIAVLDGGFMNVDKIPAFHNSKIVATRDFVVPASKSIFQEQDHGTMVLSAMAMKAPTYYQGTAPDASYVLIRCEDERSEQLVEEDYWAEAAEYADSIGCDVINSSLGYHDFDDKKTSHVYEQLDGESTLISHTASLLADKGIVCVNSAGNEGAKPWKKLGFPADAKDILTVGAINSNGVNAAFSSVGPTSDGRIKPDVMAIGVSTSLISGRGAVLSNFGTSFSAPLIAGLVACLWQGLPNKSAREIIQLVINSGDRFEHPDNIYGYGVPNFDAAFHEGQKF